MLGAVLGRDANLIDCYAHRDWQRMTAALVSGIGGCV